MKGNRLLLDDREHNDRIDEERRQHAHIDSDDETREFNIARVNVRRVGGAVLSGSSHHFSDDDSQLTEHEYEFIMGKNKEKVKVVRKLNMR